MKRILLYILVLLLALKIDAQTIPFDNFTFEDGLADNKTYQIVTDSTGFLWIGTDNGLNKFDGTTFKRYGVAEGLKSPIIVSLGIYKGALIMECFRQGIQLFEDQKAKNILSDENDLRICREFTYYNDKEYFIDHTNEAKLCYFNNNKITEIKNSFGSNCLLIIDNRLYVGTDNGLFILDKQEQLTKVNIDGLKNFAIYSIEANDSNIWLGGKHKILEIKNNKVSNVLSNKSWSHSKISHIQVDNDNNLWMSAFNGGLFYKRNNSIVTLLDTNIWISDIYKDKQGFMWVATYGNGIYKFYNSYITNYSYVLEQPHKSVTSINIIDSNVIVGAIDETIVIDSKKNIEYIDTRRILPREFIELNDDIILIGQTQENIDERIIKSKNYIFYFRQGTACIKEDTNTINVGAYGAFGSLSFSNGKFTIEKSINFKNQILSRVNAIVKIKDTFWLGTTGATFKVFNDSSIKIDNPLLSNVNDIAIDKSKTLWFATVNGLNKLAYPYNTEQTTQVYQGSFNCLEAVGDDLWAGSGEGLYVYKDNKFIVLDANQGIPGHNITALKYDPNQDNIWIGTETGIAAININEFNKVKFLPISKILFEEISSSDSLYDIANHITLNPKSSLLKIQFSALNFSIKGNAEFQYSLDGEDWATTKDKILLLTLSSLKYGKHTLTIRGKNPNSTWTYSDVLYFTIDTPYYKSSGFYALIVLLLVIIISFIIYYRIKEVKRKQHEVIEFERKMNQLQNMSLSAMMNPHFIFNSLSSIQYLVNTSKTELANTYIAKLARLIRMNLTDADEEEITLKREIERIELYLKLEQLRFEDRFDYEIKIDKNVDINKLTIPSLIIQPLIENCIKHGIMPLQKKGIITLSLKLENKLLKISIKDNGVGLKADASIHQSKGLYIIKERIHLRNDENSHANSFSINEILDKNNNVKGTMAIITLST